MTRTALKPTGGVLAGARRFQIALGPFPAGHALRFTFRCDDEECSCATGGLPDEQVVRFE